MIHKGITLDSSKNFAKSTGNNRNNTLALLSTVITPQNDRENTKQADINSTTINKPSNLSSVLLCRTSIAAQRSNLTTTGAMIARDINSELHSSQIEQTQVSASVKSDSKQSSSRLLTTPTSKPAASAVHDELLLIMQKMENDLKQEIQNLQ
eukprot:68616-Ditylum_brightwellii.AAC.1